MRPFILSAFMIACALSASHAQDDRPGALQGIVTDSVHSGPLAGTRVTALLVGDTTESVYYAFTDPRGKYRFDKLAAGRYALGFESPLLDSLEFGGASQQVDIVAGKTARADLFVPSGNTLKALACRGTSFPTRTGALMGIVTDADAERPLANADVAIAWLEATFDTTSQSISSEQRATRVTANAAGQYRVCGVPTGIWLVAQVQVSGRVGSVVRTNVIDAAGVAVLNLSFSANGSRLLARAAESPADSAAPLSGTASLLGTIRKETGELFEGAQVHLLNTATTVRTNRLGDFLLTDLPAGTHELEVRHLGYGVIRRPVDLRNGQRMRQDAQLERVVSLDSVNVIAQRSRYPEFEGRKRESVDGIFLSQLDIEKLHVPFASAIAYTVPSFRVVGNGADAKIVSSRSGGNSCAALLVVDNVTIPGLRINDVATATIGAMEFYPGFAGSPMQYRSPCGTIVIWTKR